MASSEHTADDRPRCLLVSVFKPRWVVALTFSLAFTVSVALIASLIACITEQSFELALPVLVGVSLILGTPLGLVVVIASVIDYFRIAQVKRELAGWGTDLPQISDIQLDIALTKIALKSCRDIPGKFLPPPNAKMPQAIYLGTLKHKSLPVPVSSAVPFEPLPLGMDPRRATTLLEEFVGLNQDHQTLLRSGLRIPLRTRDEEYAPTWRRSFQLIMQTLALALLFYLFVYLGKLGVYGIAFFALITFVHTWPWMKRFSGLEFGRTACWLFPGTIAIRKTSFPSFRKEELIFRRSMGTLWYDAKETKLYLPAPNGIFHYVRCLPREGLLAVWAWLNTAEPPEHIDLDNIS